MAAGTSERETAERDRSFWQEVLGLLERGPAALLPFEEVRKRLKLRPRSFRRLQHIPLDRIIGSVGRYHDFNRAFLPRRTDERWQRINMAWERGEHLPPLEVYQVGDVYFVSDGNHRVSVARANGATHIDAYVTEYESPVPLEPDTDLDDLIVKQEQAKFLERTRLHELRPDACIELTLPGGYRHLLEHIEVHRYFMEQERGRAVPWDEAVTHWHAQVYLPIIAGIHRRELLELFPGRTETDLYLWISRHQWELREHYGTYTVDADLAAADFAAQHAAVPLRRAQHLWRSALMVIGRIVPGLTPPPNVLPITVPTRIARINALPATWRRRIYRLTLPNSLLVDYRMDPVALTDDKECPVVIFEDTPGSHATLITVLVGGCDDPLLSLGLADDWQGRLHLTHLVSYRPNAPRFAVDRDEQGRPLAEGQRNLEAEAAALAAGLAPGEVRAGTAAHPAVLAQLDVLAATLDHPLFVARPRYYHEAIFFERQGFAYSWGEEWMRELDRRFTQRVPEDGLAHLQDGSTAFRQPGAATTVPGRSWAIQDGILDEPWPEFEFWMVKLVASRRGGDLSRRHLVGRRR